MKCSLTTCAIFALTISSSHVFAVESNLQSIYKCTELTNRMAGAYATDDDQLMETVAEEKVKYCSNTDNARDNSDAYAALADVRNRNGKSVTAIEAGTKCVELDPTNPGCQVRLSKAYFDIGLFEMSRKRRDAAYRLFDSDRLRIEQELKSHATTKSMESKIELLLAKLYESASLECYIRRLRLPND